jgi:hypothetical protein
MKAHPLAPHLQRFFTERLVNQLRASPNTIISYRDCTPSAKPAANTAAKIGNAGKDGLSHLPWPGRAGTRLADNAGAGPGQMVNDYCPAVGRP